MSDLVGLKPPRLLMPLSPALIEPLPRIEGGWKVIYADPPWYFRSYAPPRSERQGKPSGREVERHYRTMHLSEITAIPVRDVVARDCHLFMWVTGPMLEKCFAVAKAWGFKYSGSGFVWIKLTKRSGDAQYQLRTMEEWLMLLHSGLGFTTRKNAEFSLLFRRGNAKRIAKDVQEVIISPRREHSRKPDEAAHRIERYCDGPRLELFAREARPGWTAWGNETVKFGDISS